jgi:hypothetical protein
MHPQPRPGEIWIADIGGKEHRVKLVRPDSPGWWHAEESDTGTPFLLSERWLLRRVVEERR